MTENESLIWASSHYLTEQLPKEFANWSEEQVDEFILSNPWQPFENWSAQDVWELIDNLARSVRNDFVSKKKSDESTKTLCCSECGNDNIEWQVWADENNEISDGVYYLMTVKDVYCRDCGDKTRPIAKEKPDE